MSLESGVQTNCKHGLKKFESDTIRTYNTRINILYSREGYSADSSP